MKRPCIQQAEGVYEKIRKRNAHTSKAIPKEKSERGVPLEQER